MKRVLFVLFVILYPLSSFGVYTNGDGTFPSCDTINIQTPTSVCNADGSVSINANGMWSCSNSNYPNINPEMSDVITSYATDPTLGPSIHYQGFDLYDFYPDRTYQGTFTITKTGTFIVYVEGTLYCDNVALTAWCPGSSGWSPPITVKVPCTTPPPTSGGSGNCFEAGTLVKTPNGKKPIEELKVGEEVLSWNESDNRIVSAKVVKTFVRGPVATGVLTLEDGATISVTPEHKFYSAKQKSWTSISELKSGDTVFQIDSQKTALREIKIKSFKLGKAKAKVYNLEVEGTHNYFAADVLVHNAMGY